MTTAGWAGERDPLEQQTLTSHMTHQDIKVISACTIGLIVTSDYELHVYT